MIVWKHHLSDNFKNGKSPISNNGVGKGGTIFFDLNKIEELLGKDKYWVVPVMMDENEFEVLDEDTAESKVDRIGLGDFASIDEWRNKMRQ